MAEQKPGCIHLGDPQGWCGSFMLLAILAAIVAFVLVLIIPGRRAHG